MNIIFSIISIYFIFMRVETLTHNLTKRSSSDESNSSHGASCSSGNKHLSLPLDNVKLKIISDSHVVAQVNLKRTERVLANKNLPVWILNGKLDDDSINNADGNELTQDTEVMEQLGKFTTYQDPDSSSAAVYFHNRREFDGTIDTKFLIQKLSIGQIHFKRETKLILGKSGIKPHSMYNGHQVITSDIDPQAGVNYQKHMKTYRGHVYDGYPEVLVIVPWGLAKNLIKSVKKSDWHKTIVSYIITLFNSVDMLYSKLKYTKIQINLAGIIIGTAKESFSFLDKCFLKVTDREDNLLNMALDGDCVNNIFRDFISARDKIFPIDSYDLIIILTKYYLIDISKADINNRNDIKNYILANGMAGVIHELYEHKFEDDEKPLIAFVMDKGNYEYYPVIAHEMAHLMTVLHDSSPTFTDNNHCSGNIMKLCGTYWCDRCLSWSETSEETFNLFFSSPNCCAFINKPRSLYPPGPREMLSADEQCQCYGFQSALTPVDESENYCYTELQCKNTKKNVFENVIVPIDGTLCGNSKVCWRGSCKNIATF